LGFGVTVQNRLNRRLYPPLALQSRLLAFLNEPLAYPIHRVDVHPQHFRDRTTREWSFGPMVITEK
jgi:hypothetical protein